MKIPLIYKERPLFGFDLGSRTAKMMQIKAGGKKPQVLGYGYANFPPEAIVEGIIVDPQEIAKALAPLLKQMSFGHINATRIAASLPVAKVFTRILELPPMSSGDLDAAVRLEAEQYVPVPLPDLYIDYEIVEQTADQIEVLMVAAPRAVVDSYIKLFELMNLEVAFLETSLSSVVRAIVTSTKLDKPTVVADFGSASIDLAVHDKVIRLTNSIAIGGDQLTEQLVHDLGLPHDRANEIKFKFGLGKSGIQDKIVTSLSHQLGQITTEIKRVMKFYQDRSKDKSAIAQVVVSGGSAAMPGLLEYLEKELGVPVVMADPWAGLQTKHIPGVSKYDGPLYAAVIGLARVRQDI